MKKYVTLVVISTLFTYCTTQKTIHKKTVNTPQTILHDTISSEKIAKVFSFPKILDENSGIQVIDGFVWTFNDSGGKNTIYKTDFKGNIIQEVTIANAKNNDWEDIAHDNEAIYIGDFGNNNGNRQDLTIYKIKKSNITEDSSQTVTAEKIIFEYNDRTDFSKIPYQHDFDCESMFIYKNQIHLLAKAWKTGVGGHYVLPTKPGQYKAYLLEKLDTQGFLTAADVKNEQVAAVQYSREGTLILWHFSFDKNGLLFNNPIHSSYLGNTSHWGQIEGLTFFNNKLYISGEEMKGIAPSFYIIQK